MNAPPLYANPPTFAESQLNPPAYSFDESQQLFYCDKQYIERLRRVFLNQKVRIKEINSKLNEAKRMIPQAYSLGLAQRELTEATILLPLMYDIGEPINIVESNIQEQPVYNACYCFRVAYLCSQFSNYFTSND